LIFCGIMLNPKLFEIELFLTALFSPDKSPLIPLFQSGKLMVEGT
jgi:hypothetical protein